MPFTWATLCQNRDREISQTARLFIKAILEERELQIAIGDLVILARLAMPRDCMLRIEYVKVS
jgi:hypothetical protein